MKAIRIAGMAALLALAACGSHKREEQSAPPVPAKPVPLSKKDPVAYHANVESADAEVPTALRHDLQKVIVCTIRKRQAAHQPSILDAQMIRDLTAQIKADPNFVNTACQP